MKSKLENDWITLEVFFKTTEIPMTCTKKGLLQSKRVVLKRPHFLYI